MHSRSHGGKEDGKRKLFLKIILSIGKNKHLSRTSSCQFLEPGKCVSGTFNFLLFCPFFLFTVETFRMPVLSSSTHL